MNEASQRERARGEKGWMQMHAGVKGRVRDWRLSHGHHQGPWHLGAPLQIGNLSTGRMLVYPRERIVPILHRTVPTLRCTAQSGDRASLVGWPAELCPDWVSWTGLCACYGVFRVARDGVRAPSR